jgi:hypothetical protein
VRIISYHTALLAGVAHIIPVQFSILLSSAIQCIAAVYYGTVRCAVLTSLIIILQYKGLLDFYEIIQHVCRQRRMKRMGKTIADQRTERKRVERTGIPAVRVICDRK